MEGKGQMCLIDKGGFYYSILFIVILPKISPYQFFFPVYSHNAKEKFVLLVGVINRNLVSEWLIEIDISKEHLIDIINISEILHFRTDIQEKHHRFLKEICKNVLNFQYF